ncbi:MAG: SCO family protein [Xanthomonadales bacterium]|nr:SCO family protein [Xanthomonadales bacterium]
MPITAAPGHTRFRLVATAACLLAIVCVAAPPAAAQHAPAAYDSGGYDADAAVATSQAAIGRPLGDHLLTDSEGRPVRLADYRGRPLLISMIFTSCYHVCPAITQHLDFAVRAGREALGADSFQVITVGFDTPVDTPEAMRQFARKQGVEDPDWAFLSGSAETMAALVDNVGFVHFPSPRGFDHINQVTVVDRDGVIYRQVYGAAFELPALIEPLKQLVYNRPQPNAPIGAGLLNRIKLFCTVYDPNTGRYRFDYSLFVGIAVGAAVVLGIFALLLLEYLRARRGKRAGSGD